MASSVAIKLGCVPEHFSVPFAIAIQKGFFEHRQIPVKLILCPGGTGEMVKKLEDGSLDVAVALTEGLVAAICNGNSSFKIVGTYVESPLCWAISTGSQSKIRSVDDLSNGRIGISRIGSGSHIIPFVLADQKGWLSNCNQENSGKNEVYHFEALGNFKGLRDGVNANVVDAFMWETFMTKPFHDSGEVKRIGDITPPWPAFMFAARTEIFTNEEDTLREMLRAVNDATAYFMKNKETESIHLVRDFLENGHTGCQGKAPADSSTSSSADGMTPKQDSGHLKDATKIGHVLSEDDVREWFKTVKYPTEARYVSKSVLVDCVRTLQQAGVIGTQKDIDLDALCDRKMAILM